MLYYILSFFLQLEILFLGLFKAEDCLRKSIKPSRVKKLRWRKNIVLSNIKLFIRYVGIKCLKSRNHFKRFNTVKTHFKGHYPYNP